MRLPEASAVGQAATPGAFMDGFREVQRTVARRPVSDMFRTTEKAGHDPAIVERTPGDAISQESGRPRISARSLRPTPDLLTWPTLRCHQFRHRRCSAGVGWCQGSICRSGRGAGTGRRRRGYDGGWYPFSGDVAPRHRCRPCVSAAVLSLGEREQGRRLLAELVSENGALLEVEQAESLAPAGHGGREHPRHEQ